MKFDVVLKQFKLNILRLLIWGRVLETREITAVLLTASKNFSIGMQSDVYESIWLKLGVMTHAIVLYILILV